MPKMGGAVLFDFIKKLLKKKVSPETVKRYAAAKTPRSMGGWNAVNTNDFNDMVTASGPILAGRTRQLCRDFSYFARARNLMVDYTVGTGIIFQSQVLRPDGSLWTEKNQEIDDQFNYWSDECDIAGKRNFYELMRLAKTEEVETGEFLIVKRKPRRKTRFPFALQVIDSAMIKGEPKGRIPKNLEVKNGIKYDIYTGEILSIFVNDEEEIKAEDVIHGFESLRAGQLRGVTRFAPGILLANELSTLLDSSLDTAVMASKYLMFITTPDPGGLQNAIGAAKDSSTGNIIENIENTIFQYLDPGEKAEFADPPNIGSNLDPLSRLILRMLSITAGVPYDLLTMDTSDLNYSKAKITRLDFYKTLDVWQWQFSRWFCQPIAKEFYKHLALGTGIMPGFFTDPSPWLKPVWHPPGRPSIDPAKEMKSKLWEIDAALSSEIDYAKRVHGRNYEDILKEKKEAATLREKYGVNTVEANEATATNPAAIEEQK